MSGLPVLAALVVLAVAAVAMTSGILSFHREGAAIGVTVRRGSGRHATPWLRFNFDAGEGLVTYVLVLALAWLTGSVVAGSQWIQNSGAVGAVCLVAALAGIVLAKVAPRGTTYWLAVEVSAVLALFVVTASHHGLAVDRDFVAWVQAVRGSLQLALLVSLVALTWLSCAWLTFWVVRKRNVLIGLVPMAIALVVEVINDPDQPGLPFLVAVWLVIVVALAIRINLARLDRRWRFEASEEVSISVAMHGARVLAVILVLGFIVIPPLSRTDLSARLWGAQNHTGPNSPTGQGRQASGPGGPLLQTGYTEKVQPGGTIVRSQAQVLEVDNDFSPSMYWRGIDLYAVRNGAWETGGTINTFAAPAGVNLSQDSYLARKQVHATIKILGEPQATLFWPGDPLKTSVPTQLRGGSVTPGPPALPGGAAFVLDGAYAAIPVPTGKTYTVDASYSVATEAQLRTAGLVYPPSILALADRQPSIGRTFIDPRVAALADQVSAAAANPYDKAKAIESYLRQNMHYQLQVDVPPRGADPVANFLFQTRTGYCEYFASSMGEMLHSIGIPVRLVNGYGPGAVSTGGDRELNVGFEGSTTPPRIIHAADAHTWVEVFFPRFGWVPFEPTPDPAYPALERGASLAAPQVPVVAPAPAPPTTTAAAAAPPQGLAVLLQPLVVGPSALVLVLVILALVLLLARGPRRLDDVGTAWRRLRWLAARLGVRSRDSDTPMEFAARLAQAMPALGDEIRSIGRAYSERCYRRGGLGSGERGRAEAAWSRVRSSVVRVLVMGGLRAG